MLLNKHGDEFLKLGAVPSDEHVHLMPPSLASDQGKFGCG